jgi:hypothetical protein
VGEDPFVGFEALHEVGCCCEEHVPVIVSTCKHDMRVFTYHAHSIATPSRRKTEYSSHEKGGSSVVLVRVAASLSSASACNGAYS